MSFRKLDFNHLARFNSSTSSKFLDSYNEFVSSKISSSRLKKVHKSIAPSSFRCDRRCWFKLRGVDPDVNESPDLLNEFTARIGTACHRIIQSNLLDMLGENWISLDDYLKSISFPFNYTLKPSEDSLETFINIEYPPIRFACDGVVKLNDSHYLLEIKTCEYSTWNNLTGIKDEHIDQIRCYSAILGLDDVLVMYQDRQYGQIKCYESHFDSSNHKQVFDKIERIMLNVKSNIAPSRLPRGDKWCSPSMCPYYRKCKEY